MDKEDVLHTHTMEYYSAKKKNEICSNIGGPRKYHAQQNKRQKNTVYHSYVKSKKKNECI